MQSEPFRFFIALFRCLVDAPLSHCKQKLPNAFVSTKLNCKQEASNCKQNDRNLTKVSNPSTSPARPKDILHDQQAAKTWEFGQWLGEGQKGTPRRGRDRKCHDRASLSRPLVLSLGPLTSLTSFPLFCTSEDIKWEGPGGGGLCQNGVGG